MTALRIVVGSIPWTSLWACCRPRRRIVSDMARRIELVIASAYMITWPSTLRAARPMVWISDVSLRRKPSLSASRMATSDTSGRSRPSRSRFEGGSEARERVESQSEPRHSDRAYSCCPHCRRAN